MCNFRITVMVIAVIALSGAFLAMTDPSRGAESVHDVSASTCDMCHRSLTALHYSGLNPYLDPEALRTFESSEKKRLASNPSCGDCHVPHDTTNNRNLLSSQYLQIAAISRSLNPHWCSVLCISCHVQSVPTSDKSVLVRNGDTNGTCNRCHHSEFARTEIHPVGIIPSEKINVPPEMPLDNGKLTCKTCHQCSLQKSALTADSEMRRNRNFLRHNALSRTEFCFLCHVSESYRRLNPHKQLDDLGEIQEEVCLFCHSSRPDVTVLGPEHVTFVVDNPNQYCTGCHPGFDTKHPSGGSHLVTPSENILRALSTSIERIGVELPLFRGKIVCTTCHNPHEEGVIRIPAAASGAQRQHKLRLIPGMNLCTGCHWDK